MAARSKSAELAAAPRELEKMIRDLERRALLQYDALAQRYDLHPVVRGVTAGRLEHAETEQYGQRVIDYFLQRPHDPYGEAETLDDVRDGLHVVRTLRKMGRYEQAANACAADLGYALAFNLEAYAELLALIRPFFERGWNTLREGLIPTR